MATITHLEKRRIQMEYVVPLIKDLQAILGEEVVLAALAERNRRAESQAADAGKDVNPDFGRMVKATEGFAAGDAMDYEVITSTDSAFDMNVFRCGYAEMMAELGGAQFGHLLICNGDFAAAGRIGMKLERSQTRMQGDDFCNFRYRPATADPQS